MIQVGILPSAETTISVACMAVEDNQVWKVITVMVRFEARE